MTAKLTATGPANILGTLMARGYFPLDTPDWYELTCGPVGVVRVVLDDNTIEIHVLDNRDVCQSTTKVTSVSTRMLDAVLAAAEDDAKLV
jgi:catabolite regulation protein CreA